MGGRNNRIRDHLRANQYCLRRRLDESLLRASTSKLVYQQHRLQAEVPECADLRPVLGLKATSAPRRCPNSRLREHDPDGFFSRTKTGRSAPTKT